MSSRVLLAAEQHSKLPSAWRATTSQAPGHREARASEKRFPVPGKVPRRDYLRTSRIAREEWVRLKWSAPTGAAHLSTLASAPTRPQAPVPRSNLSRCPFGPTLLPRLRLGLSECQYPHAIYKSAAAPLASLASQNRLATARRVETRLPLIRVCIIVLRYVQGAAFDRPL
jgi:hypothetical protein